MPFYFSDNQRRALLAAGQIAGVNLLKIVNENTAVGIAYGMYKGSTFPPEKDPAKIVAFVDVGHSCVQASVMGFNERKVAVLILRNYTRTQFSITGGLGRKTLVFSWRKKRFIWFKCFFIDSRCNTRSHGGRSLL